MALNTNKQMNQSIIRMCVNGFKYIVGQEKKD